MIARAFAGTADCAGGPREPRLERIHLLLVTWHGGGNVPPLLGISSELLGPHVVAEDLESAYCEMALDEE